MSASDGFWARLEGPQMAEACLVETSLQSCLSLELNPLLDGQVWPKTRQSMRLAQRAKANFHQ